MNIKARWEGFDALEADFAALSKGLQGQALRGALRAAASPVLKRAQDDSPSRAVRKSLKSVVSGSGLKAIARVGAKKKTRGARILHLVEKGTTPHFIVLRRKKLLADGRNVFGKVVRHPGGRARPFFVQALPREREESERKFKSALRQIIDKMRLRKLKQQAARAGSNG